METRFGSLIYISSIVLFIFFTGSGLVCGDNRRPKNVQVAVRAKWEGTPILLEAAELFSAKDWKHLYWDFIDVWIAENNENSSNTARDCLKRVLRHGNHFLSEPMSSLFEFSLILRSASPRLVLYRQLAEESLSSFPLMEDAIDNSSMSVAANTLEENVVERTNPLHVSISANGHGVKCCWVDTGNTLFFALEELLFWLSNPIDLAGANFQQPELFDFDHIHFDSHHGSPITILYGALGTDCFSDFHVALVDAARKGRVTYVVRPILPSGCEASVGNCGAVGATDSVNLGGYGVELALKNMEYKAMDDTAIKEGASHEDFRIEDLSQEIRGFIFSKILERKPDLASEITSFRDFLLSSTISDTLDIWELKDLGYQTAQRIVQASDPLHSMQEINQNFPSIVSSLSRTKLNSSVKDEIAANQQMIMPGKTLFAVNGALISSEDLDLYTLLDLVQQELVLAEQFSNLKIPRAEIRKLLSTLSPAESNVFRVDFRSNHVHYLNNLEEDAMYKRWRNNINEILMPVFTGQLRYIRKNLYHAVYVIDPATTCGVESIDLLMTLYENHFPIRFGLILYSLEYIKRYETGGDENDSQNEMDLSTLIIQLFIYVKENYGAGTAFQFMRNIKKAHVDSVESGKSVPTLHDVEEAFVETLLSKAKSPPQSTLLKLEKEQLFKNQSHDSSVFVFKLGLSKMSCCMLLNGLVFDSTEDSLLTAINDEVTRIQEHVYYGRVNSRSDILDKFLSENGIRRYNPRIVGDSQQKPTYISMLSSSSLSLLGHGSVMSDVNYLHSPKSSESLKPVTHLLILDITSKKGPTLFREGIHYLIQGSEIGRLGVLFNVGHNIDLSSLLFIKVFQMTASSYSHKKNVLTFLDHLCSFFVQNSLSNSSSPSKSAQEFLAEVYELAAASGLPAEAYESALSAFSADEIQQYLKKVAKCLHIQFGIHSGMNVVITSGRVMMLNEWEMFVSHDLHLLESVEFKRRTKKILEIIEKVQWQDMDPDVITSNFISNVIMYVSSAMATRDRGSESAHFEMLHGEHSAIVIENENSWIHIDALIDPLSPIAQKVASLLGVMKKYIQPRMRIILNPISSLADLPLKNYYRYVIPTLDDFSSVDYLVNGPKAVFTNMPLSKTLTMNLDVPDPWLVEPVIAVHDLDNILLENLGDTRTLQAVFELEALILTGHCSEKDHEPPRGLQLILGSKRMPHSVDTIVMANLGYWQMKVSPGVWYLQLASGRSSDLYVLKDDDNGAASSKCIIISNLQGNVVRLEVTKKKGMEHEKLLVSNDSDDDNDDNDEHYSRGKYGATRSSWNSNFLKWASGFIGSSQSTRNRNSLVVHEKSGQLGKTVNIFSVASGHLYERFLKIMILSVLKNTHRSVKFWFIKNYLSPQFKDVIPHMAQEYGFEYELITYKWPTWLHKQKEKQRIIWAYKILFLDVIFPLYLDKVIFVDADQVVRADIGDLYDMDIKGRPLAYTPFCDNNKDMDGFRFWRQGFWRDHLQGKPYHISALYVVDLVKFRRTAAGDNLRVFYETLSKDPNSLSNLDQDLPNYAQHMVPIFSLPQEWLWCESWCGNATKSKAKTIDLCNNPMTKEPKLQGAKRIVSEWVDLDLEARQFTERVSSNESSLPESIAFSEKSKRHLKEEMESQAEL